jgi:hypothetical protein
MHCRIAPAFDYGRAEHRTDVLDPDGLRFTGPGLALALRSSVPLTADSDGGAGGDFALRPGEVATFVLDVLEADAALPPPADADALLDATTAFWRGWLARSRYTGGAGARWCTAPR